MVCRGDCFSDAKSNYDARGVSSGGGLCLKEQIAHLLRVAGHGVVDSDTHRYKPRDDYPDFVLPMAWAVSCGDVERGVALCGRGVVASIAANKVPGLRAGLIHDVFSAHQGIEDDKVNVSCLGGRVIGSTLARELLDTFLKVRFSGPARHERRIANVQVLEHSNNPCETQYVR